MATNKLTPEIIAATNAVKGLNAEIKQLATELKKLGEGTKAISDKQKASNTEYKKLIESKKKVGSVTKQLIEAQDKEVAARIRLQEAQRRQKQELRSEIQLQNAVKGSTDRYSAGVKKLELRLRQVNQTTVKGRKEADSLRKGIDRLNKSITRQSSALNKQRRNIGNYGSAVRGLAGSIKTLAGAYIGLAGIRSLGRFFSSSLEAYDKQIVAERQLSAALNGRVTTTENIIRLASELQGKTIYGDEETIAAAKSLAIAGLQNERQLKRLLPLIQDIAAAEGITLAKATKKVTTAIASGSTTLEKYGVELSATATLTENADMAIKGLTESVQGQAEILANEGMGSIKQLGNTWGDFKESVGGAVASLLEASGIITGLNKKLGNTTQMLNDEMIPAWQKFAATSNAAFEALLIAQTKMRAKLNEMKGELVLTTQETIKAKGESVAYAEALAEVEKRAGKGALATKLANLVIQQAKLNNEQEKAATVILPKQTKATKDQAKAISSVSDEIEKLKAKTVGTGIFYEFLRGKEGELETKIGEEMDRAFMLMERKRLEEEARLAVDQEPFFQKLFGVDEEGLQQIQQGLTQLLGELNNFLAAGLAARKQAAEEEVQISDKKISELEGLLDKEVEANKNAKDKGIAFDRDKEASLRQQINVEKVERAKALEERKKIARQEKALAISASILNTAAGVAKALATANIPLAVIIGAIGALQIATISAQKFAEGGTFGATIEGGKSHAQGGNLQLVETEKKEMHGILSKPATRKHGAFYKEVTDMLNADKPINHLFGDRISPVLVNNSFDFSKNTKEIQNLRKDFQELKHHLEGQPYRVEGNKRYYKNRIEISL